MLDLLPVIVTELLLSPVGHSVEISLSVLLELLPVLVELGLLKTSATSVVSASGVSRVPVVGVSAGAPVVLVPSLDSLVVSASSLVLLLGLSSAMSKDSLLVLLSSGLSSLDLGSLVLSLLGGEFLSLVGSSAVSVFSALVGDFASR